MSTSPNLDPLAFAEKLLSLLDTGRKTATYKFATLVSLIDLCVEQSAHEQEAVELSGREVGRRVFEMYWRQAVPYSGDSRQPRYLRHSVLSPKRQPDLVIKIERFRQRHHLLTGVSPEQAAARAPDEFARLMDDVVVTVIRMPLPKLQRFNVGGQTIEDRFLFDYGWPDEVPERVVRAGDFADTLRLGPGVAAMLARLGALLRPVIEARWTKFVADRSREVVEESDVRDFLFGADRVSLAPVREPLLDLQHGSCFYCRERVQSTPDVDHFIPWVRHPDNGIENLVVAHSRCNNRKRDSMAASEHLRRWLERNHEHHVDLSAVAKDVNWTHRPERTRGAARATYSFLPEGTLLWVHDWQYETLDPAAVERLLTGAAVDIP